MDVGVIVAHGDVLTMVALGMRRVGDWGKNGCLEEYLVTCSSVGLIVGQVLCIVYNVDIQLLS